MLDWNQCHDAGLLTRGWKNVNIRESPCGQNTFWIIFIKENNNETFIKETPITTQAKRKTQYSAGKKQHSITFVFCFLLRWQSFKV